MKSTPTKATLALFTLTALAAMAATEQSPRAVLGKIDFLALYDAAPGPPADSTEAGKRGLGKGDYTTDKVALDTFYAPFRKRVSAARNDIQGALDGESARSAARAKRTVAQANASPLISRMGGVEKMSAMSEAELQQSTSKAMGDYAQSMSGAPPGVNVGGGMQAMMQRVMSDPAYQERFEKMSRKEQEAEMQKMMGNAHAPPPPTGPTAAERQAKVATDEGTAAMARQNALADIYKQINGIAAIDADFDKKDQAIRTAPGSHKDIDAAYQAKYSKLPVTCNDMGCSPAAAAVVPLERDRVTRNRARASSELPLRAALYAQRKGKYKELAAAYTAWLKQDKGPPTTPVAQQVDEGTIEIALHAESELIGYSERLAGYSAEVTRDTAGYVREFQDRSANGFLPPAFR